MLEALIAGVIVSLASLTGIVLLKSDERTIFLLVSFATGVFIGAFFLHVLPKVSPLGEAAYVTILASFVGFALLEKFLHFHNHETRRSIGWMNLVGDFFHNFIDGLGIAGAFKVSPSFGWLFTFIVLAHEVPQELGDFAVLLYSGFHKKEAILLNFLVSLTALLGIVVGWLINVNPIYLVAIVGGSFLYIGASDLLPLLREKTPVHEVPLAFGLFLLGILLMELVKHL